MKRGERKSKRRKEADLYRQTYRIFQLAAIMFIIAVAYISFGDMNERQPAPPGGQTAQQDAERPDITAETSRPVEIILTEGGGALLPGDFIHISVYDMQGALITQKDVRHATMAAYMGQSFTKGQARMWIVHPPASAILNALGVTHPGNDPVIIYMTDAE